MNTILPPLKDALYRSYLRTLEQGGGRSHTEFTLPKLVLGLPPTLSLRPLPCAMLQMSPGLSEMLPVLFHMYRVRHLVRVSLRLSQL